MSWDPVPWFVGGGANHSADVARVLAYFAFNGQEGILSPASLAVKELAVPSTSVRVVTGVCSILSRAAGGSYQAYVGRLPVEEVIPISATGSTGGRSDLVVARVENPHEAGEPWAQPSDVTVGPYIFTRVIPNVPATTTTLQQVRPNDTGLALARIDVPASTGTITQAMVKDLRALANPRRDLQVTHQPTEVDDSLNVVDPNWERFPNGANLDVNVPVWARTVKVWGFVEGLRLTKAGRGVLRFVWTDDLTGGEWTQVNESAPTSGSDRRGYNIGGQLAVPAAYRGTVQRLAIQGRAATSGAAGFLKTDDATSAMLMAQFEESPAQD